MLSERDATGNAKRRQGKANTGTTRIRKEVGKGEGRAEGRLVLVVVEDGRGERERRTAQDLHGELLSSKRGVLGFGSAGIGDVEVLAKVGFLDTAR
jgi:hypothetical protein